MNFGYNLPKTELHPGNIMNEIVKAGNELSALITAMKCPQQKRQKLPGQMWPFS